MLQAARSCDFSFDVRAQVYQAIARALGCLTLFFFANLLKTLAAKIMATSFHTEAHFQKMQEALQKV